MARTTIATKRAKTRLKVAILDGNVKMMRNDDTVNFQQSKLKGQSACNRQNYVTWKNLLSLIQLDARCGMLPQDNASITENLSRQVVHPVRLGVDYFANANLNNLDGAP